jgi:hypothetical protein
MPTSANKTFIFTVYTLVPDMAHVYESKEICKIAATFEEALALLTETNPEHCIAEHLKGLWRVEE